MTPQERQLVEQLFDRLATLESAPRDADAERAIRDGLARAPNALYALVQTALLQDEALRRANARIEELEHAAGEPAPQQQGGFLDSLRNAMFGEEPKRGGGSVPSVPATRAGEAAERGAFGAGRPMGVPPGFGQGAGPAGSAPGPFGGAPGGPFGGPAGPAGPAFGGGRGSFLGTAAAAAAGVIGGSLLLDGIRNMMGSGHAAPAGQGALDAGAGGGERSPWGGGGRGNDDIARQAGLDDIGGRSAGAFDDPSRDPDRADDRLADYDHDDPGFDDAGADFGGDYDTA